MPTMSNACVFWAGGLNKKYLVRKLTKVQRLACLMILSAFPGTSTGAPELLLNITPILRNFYWLRQCEGHTESLLVGSGMSTQLVPLGKQKAMLMFAMRQGNSYLYCKCQLTEYRKQSYLRETLNVKIWTKKNAIRFGSILNQSTAKVYTDGSKLNGRVGAPFLCRIPKQLPKTSIFPHWNLQHCVPGRSLSYFRSG